MIVPDASRPPFGPDRRYWRRRANRQVRKERRTRAAVRLLGLAGVHLALDDIRESINEMRYYREHFLRLA